MNIINQEVQNITQTDFSYEGIMKFVERVGRICYNSTDKITKNSWKKFIEMLRTNKHYSPFGLATVHLKMNYTAWMAILDNVTRPEYRNYGGTKYDETTHTLYVTLSARIIEEQDLWEIVKKYIDKNPCDYYPKRSTVYCTTSIAVSRELNRHKYLSTMEKSTRYTECFDIIKPYWYDDAFDKEFVIDNKNFPCMIYEQCCENSFKKYNQLIEIGLKKQEARGVLPLDTVTNVIYTAYDLQWKDVFEKRLVSGAHPDCKKLVSLIKSKIF